MTNQEIIDSLIVGDEAEEITNPYTGEKRILEPLAVALYDYIKGCELTKNYDKLTQALGIFVEKWPEEYYALLD